MSIVALCLDIVAREPASAIDVSMNWDQPLQHGMVSTFAYFGFGQGLLSVFYRLVHVSESVCRQSVFHSNKYTASARPM